MTEADLREIRLKHTAGSSYSASFSSSRLLGMHLTAGGRVFKVDKGSQADRWFVEAEHVITKVGYTYVSSSTSKQALFDLIKKTKAENKTFTIRFRKPISTDLQLK